MSALMHTIMYLLSPVQMGSLVERRRGVACGFRGVIIGRQVRAMETHCASDVAMATRLN